MSFVILPHIADLRLQVTGENQKDLFISGLEGMNQVIKPDFCVIESELIILEDLDLESDDQTTLLIDFLSQVLSLTHAHKAIFCQVEFQVLTDTSLTATLHGQKVDRFSEDIKAVTYHEADIAPNDQGQLETVIVFDI